MKSISNNQFVIDEDKKPYIIAEIVNSEVQLKKLKN